MDQFKGILLSLETKYPPKKLRRACDRQKSWLKFEHTSVSNVLTCSAEDEVLEKIAIIANRQKFRRKLLRQIRTALGWYSSLAD